MYICQKFITSRVILRESTTSISAISPIEKSSNAKKCFIWLLWNDIVLWFFSDGDNAVIRDSGRFYRFVSTSFLITIAERSEDRLDGEKIKSVY